MAAFQVSISIDDLAKRMRQRLSGQGATAGAQVVWQRDGQRALLHLDSLQVRAVDGWLLCNLDLETDPTRRQQLQFVYFLGQIGEGDRLQAAATINASTVPAAQLADRWGEDLQRVLWDAVLDGIEASVRHVKDQNPGQPALLQGFVAQSDALRVQVLAGAP